MTYRYMWGVLLLGVLAAGILVGRHFAREESKDEAAAVASAPGAGPFPYVLHRPSRTITLPRLLKEVSGITVTGPGELAMVHDESGHIYLYSTPRREILDRFVFRPIGDFEGIAVDGTVAYALRSDGTIFVVPRYRQPEPVSYEVDTFLSPADDAEGLALDPVTGKLLVGIKEPPLVAGQRQVGKRAIYRFDPRTFLLEAEPFMLLDMRELKEVYDAPGGGFEGGKFKPERKAEFQPSDLAVHPITGEFYHIAAVGQLLVVTDRTGSIRHVAHLPPRLFRQPEGITFDSRGDMYISNEGAGSAPTLLQFSYVSQ